MEATDRWPQLWQALWEHGASDRKEEGARRYWEGLTQAEQEAVFNSLISKLRKGEWVQYDPIRAMKEHTPKLVLPMPEPTNYNKKALPNVPVFSAKYNGQWGMYTKQDIEMFHMELPTKN